MVEFFRKIENHGIKIAQVNLILITKSIDLQLFTLILYSEGGSLRSKAIFHAQSIYREIYDTMFDINNSCQSKAANARVFSPVLEFSM